MNKRNCFLRVISWRYCIEEAPHDLHLHRVFFALVLPFLTILFPHTLQTGLLQDLFFIHAF